MNALGLAVLTVGASGWVVPHASSVRRVAAHPVVSVAPLPRARQTRPPLGTTRRRGTPVLPPARMNGGGGGRASGEGGQPELPREAVDAYGWGYDDQYGGYPEAGWYPPEGQLPRAVPGGPADKAAARAFAPRAGEYAGTSPSAAVPFSSRWWSDLFKDPDDRDAVGLGYDWREWAEPALVRRRVRLQQTVATIRRVIVPSIVCTILGVLYFDNITGWVMSSLDKGGLEMVMTDQSQFIQNFLTVIGLLFSILAGNAYSSLYTQQETIYFALFQEVSEAKSLLEQTTLVCQGRPFYPAVLAQFELYVSQDLRRLDLPPAYLLSSRPAEDPLEAIMFMTSVGVPSVIYETVKSLRQARGHRLGACQRKFPSLGIALLYVLALLELVAFPLLGAGTATLSMRVLNLQSSLFGLLCGALVMVLRVIQELRLSSGGVFTVDLVLRQMVSGLEAELEQRRRAASFPPLFGAEPGRRGPPSQLRTPPLSERPSARASPPGQAAPPPPPPPQPRSNSGNGAAVAAAGASELRAPHQPSDSPLSPAASPPRSDGVQMGRVAPWPYAPPQPRPLPSPPLPSVPHDGGASGADADARGAPASAGAPAAPATGAPAKGSTPLHFWRRAFDDGTAQDARSAEEAARAQEATERDGRRRRWASTIASAAAAALALFDL